MREDVIDDNHNENGKYAEVGTVLETFCDNVIEKGSIRDIGVGDIVRNGYDS